MPNFYEYAGQKYSINFPVHWAADHKEGTGPFGCDTCKHYGCEDGIFKNYCLVVLLYYSIVCFYIYIILLLW